MATVSLYDRSIESLYEIRGLGDGKVTHLNLHMNRLTTLDGAEEKGASALIELDVSSNLLRSLKGVGHLANLTVLNVSANRLLKIPDCANLINLQRFIGSYNTFKEFSGLRKCSNLLQLELEGNSITDLNSLAPLKELSRLEKVSFRVAAQSLTLSGYPEEPASTAPYTASNPVCALGAYRGTVLKLLPHLVSLDKQTLAGVGEEGLYGWPGNANAGRGREVRDVSAEASSLSIGSQSTDTPHVVVLQYAKDDILSSSSSSSDSTPRMVRRPRKERHLKSQKGQTQSQTQTQTQTQSHILEALRMRQNPPPPPPPLLSPPPSFQTFGSQTEVLVHEMDVQTEIFQISRGCSTGGEWVASDILKAERAERGVVEARERELLRQVEAMAVMRDNVTSEVANERAMLKQKCTEMAQKCEMLTATLETRGADNDALRVEKHKTSLQLSALRSELHRRETDHHNQLASLRQHHTIDLSQRTSDATSTLTLHQKELSEQNTRLTADFERKLDESHTTHQTRLETLTRKFDREKAELIEHHNDTLNLNVTKIRKECVRKYEAALVELSDAYKQQKEATRKYHAQAKRLEKELGRNATELEEVREKAQRAATQHRLAVEQQNTLLHEEQRGAEELRLKVRELMATPAPPPPPPPPVMPPPDPMYSPEAFHVLRTETTELHRQLAAADAHVGALTDQMKEKEKAIERLLNQLEGADEDVDVVRRQLEEEQAMRKRVEANLQVCVNSFFFFFCVCLFFFHGHFHGAWNDNKEAPFSYPERGKYSCLNLNYNKEMGEGN